ncbi:D-lactate dehydrogenase [Staphylococcus pettenkoferi]|uniref:D-lactate dehydrogenase n=1 Tax=Staphylococcus pettenkoferi TaxID=170573 RepID=UPI00066D11AD|nr:D-lactate dehydrogenase [Staphylococcus pettenkoferi]MCI2802711.1 D-lactate dehydrogenase [Staphylococcus pettenkoferi]MCY1574282.1 D-lactate dehydrogenase [Staphylococcus pettenkoferi]MCY1577567.1 D-lactate dehydrogenase [Staphylococcus pettenkoferi]MCY1585133.1 D-lactate dehydrogenase [Staphylococcus pettenkoferi]MCY1614974.1 D-lactate dehydrogenase [Staphylococcus pettenkoferi]
MTTIKLFGVRPEDRPFIDEWKTKHNVEIEETAEILNDDNVDTVQGFDGVSISQQIPLSETVFQKLHEFGIKQLAQRSAGYDFLDLDLARKYDIIITNVPSYSPRSIAEYTVMQALNLVRKTSAIQTKTANYDFRWEPSIMSRSIQDLTVAIIGAGRIGSQVAEIFAKGFNARVVGYDLEPDNALSEIVEYQSSLEEAVQDADIVTVHVPGSAANHYLFNDEVFKAFKEGAYFINCARGSVVETQALLAHLDNGHIAGAALDTYEGEKGLFPSDQRGTELQDDTLVHLIERPDVLVSPHIAFYTDAAVKNLIVDALDATLQVIQTGDTPFRVN